MTTTQDEAGRSRRPRRPAVALGVAALLVGGAAVWATRTVAEIRRDDANPFLHSLEVARERLHDQVGAVRYDDPDSVGRAAVQGLTDGTGNPFRFVATDEDGTTTTEVLLTASVTRGVIKASQQTTSVCLTVTVTPRSFWGGRGSVTSEQTPCTRIIPPSDGVAPPAETLDRHRTSVRRPAPTPGPEERPRFPVCYSGSDCEDEGFGG
ncbi:hypothetical protein [Cellulomonas xylanilytica]|uniref:hypothetical protein n=1 Tax=Cellulomonas xylanilytica TaxID=233583 RepID=UPI0011BE724D|nr:hypothetical protein [Cellulomonas xylanilytica]